MSEIVTYEADGRVAVITLNRPDARNAVNGDVARGLEAAVDQLEADDDVWVGILAANTEGQARPVFCAGADLKAVNAGKTRPRHQARRLRRLRLPRAAQADHRRRRRPGHGRRVRDRARRRPRRRHHPLLVRARRGQAQPRRRRRRPVPPPPGHRPGGGDGGDPHRRADPGRAGLRPRPRLPARRTRRGASPRPAAWPTRSRSTARSPSGRAAAVVRAAASEDDETLKKMTDDGDRATSWARRTSRRASPRSSRSGPRSGRAAERVRRSRVDTVIRRAVMPARS